MLYSMNLVSPENALIKGLYEYQGLSDLKTRKKLKKS